jgi:hypothetical protein
VPWKLTVRAGPRVRRSFFGSLPDALRAAEEAARELADHAGGRPVDLKLRRFEPEAQVVGRLELSGPQRLLPEITAGLDIRGDGSMQAHRGRVRRRALQPAEGESALEALERELARLER